MNPKKTLAISLLLSSGVALACSQLPMPIPPVPIRISPADIVKARLAGFSNPAYGAAMTKLDLISPDPQP